MELSLGSLSSATWQLHQVSGLAPLSFSPVKPGPGRTGSRKARPGIRCSTEEGERLAKDSSGRKSAAHGSWLHTDSVADLYAGWTSEESQSNANGTAGWVKIGGALFLAIGFALGARSMYSRKDIVKELAVPLPVKEQVVSPSTVTDSSGISDTPDGSNLITEAKENIPGGLVKQEKEPLAEDNASELHQKDITPGQVSLSCEDVEDYNEKDGNFTVSSAAATAPASNENLDFKEGFQGTSTAELSVNLGSSEDSLQPESIESHSIESLVRGSQVDTKIPDEVSVLSVASNVVESDANEIPSISLTSPPDFPAMVSSSVVTSEVSISTENELYYLSSKEQVTSEDETLSESPLELNVSNGSNLESMGGGRLSTQEEEKKLHEPPMPASSLHNAYGSVQSVASQLEGFSSSSKESGIEKKSSGHVQWDERNCDVEPFASALASERWHFTSAGIPAPSTPSAAAQATLGRVVVPAPVDHMQEQALAALQALKVIEVTVEPGAICTRREYARWLIAASGTLSRSPAHKVFPAMYIESASELAFDDVLPEDPDFPFIQGLAEAGLISSKLSKRDRQDNKGSGQLLDESNDSVVFLPDSPLTRQDLVSWKLALERQLTLPVGHSTPVGKEVLQEISGFIDIQKIHQDAWPALLADLSAGEKSIISLAFGYTRRFQPEKPVTKAQAAIALATGEAAELVSEELTRLEAESIAEAAVAAELALETKAEQEVTAAFNGLLEAEREKREVAVKLAETTCAELEKLKTEREEEKYSLLRERAAVESEKELLSMLRHEVEEQALTLSSAKLEVAFEKGQVEKLHAEAEEERGTLGKVRSELEIEKNALSLARLWAEDEARKAIAHAKVLEQARKRWEDQGVQVQVDKELDEINIPGPSWHYSEEFQQQKKSPMNELLTKSKDFCRVVMEAVIRFLQFLQFAFMAIRDKASESLGELGKTAEEVRSRAANFATKTAEGVQQTVSSSAMGVSSGLREGTRRLADEWKGGAERLAQKFKIS